MFDESENGLRITTTELGDATLLALQGELDPLTAPDLLARVDDVLSQSDTTHLVFDVGGLTFIDSSGLRTLIATKRSMLERGGDLEIRNATTKTRRLLEITGLDTFLQVTP